MGEGPAHVRFGSLADICSAKRHVRFTPNSDRESGHAANDHVCFRPESGRVQRTGSRLLWANSGHGFAPDNAFLMTPEQYLAQAASLRVSGNEYLAQQYDNLFKLRTGNWPPSPPFVPNERCTDWPDRFRIGGCFVIWLLA
jgi:hypothetical protein